MSYKSYTQRADESLAVLRLFISKFGKYTVAFSHQAEDAVLLDLVKQVDPSPDVFTLDTGKLFDESDEYGRTAEKFFGVKIQSLKPDRTEVERMTAEHGEQLYYESIELRKLCCHVRKVKPLQRHLKNYTMWLTGLRREQSPTRADLETMEYDATAKIYKINPLLDWSTEQIFNYINDRKIPLNPLYGQGYPSIGCACCTRPVKQGEDIRSGRWWWEDPSRKECGLHTKHK